MDNKTIQNGKWLRLIVLILGGGTIFKLTSLKDAFYVPMQEVWGLTHTQIGFALSVYSIVMTIGYALSMYISDRYSKKKLIPFSLISVGFVGFYLATFPNYYGFLLAYAALAVFGEMCYWPTLLKAVRLLGDKTEQGRLFGFLEAGRGVVDTIVAFSALAIYMKMGEGGPGLRAAIIFYSVIVIAVGIITYFLLEDDVIRDKSLKGETIGKTRATIEGIKQTLTYPEIWVASFNIFFIYSVYCGLTSFIPFLRDVYALPVALVGAYGIINQYGLKMVGGPIGGYMADKKMKSASKYLRLAALLSAVGIMIIYLLPHESMNVYAGMAVTLGFGAIIFTQRAVFFAPMEEIETPREIAGSAMSLGSFIGYAPGMFAYTLYGSILDANPGLVGYKRVWLVMFAFSLMGLACSHLLVKMVEKKQIEKATQNAS